MIHSSILQRKVRHLCRKSSLMEILLFIVILELFVLQLCNNKKWGKHDITVL